MTPLKSKEMTFKASRKASHTFDAYRQIIKGVEGKEIDMNFSCDDVITVDVRNVNSISIDCNKKT